MIVLYWVIGIPFATGWFAFLIWLNDRSPTALRARARRDARRAETRKLRQRYYPARGKSGRNGPPDPPKDEWTEWAKRGAGR